MVLWKSRPSSFGALYSNAYFGCWFENGRACRHIFIIFLIMRKCLIISGQTCTGKSAVTSALLPLLDTPAVICADRPQMLKALTTLTNRHAYPAKSFLFGHVPLEAPYNTDLYARDLGAILESNSKVR